MNPYYQGLMQGPYQGPMQGPNKYLFQYPYQYPFQYPYQYDPYFDTRFSKKLKKDRRRFLNENFRKNSMLINRKKSGKNLRRRSYGDRLSDYLRMRLN
jgi:hypothetical protein